MNNYSTLDKLGSVG